MTVSHGRKDEVVWAILGQPPQLVAKRTRQPVWLTWDHDTT